MSNTHALCYSDNTEYVFFADRIPQVKRQEALEEQKLNYVDGVLAALSELESDQRFECVQKALQDEIYRALSQAKIVLNNQEVVMPGMVKDHHVGSLMQKVCEFQGDGVITAHQWFAWLVEVMGEEVSEIEVNDSSNISVHCDLDVSKHVNLYKMTVKSHEEILTVKSHEEIKQSTKSSGKTLPVKKMTFTQQLIERLDERNNQSIFQVLVSGLKKLMRAVYSQFTGIGTRPSSNKSAFFGSDNSRNLHRSLSNLSTARQALHDHNARAITQL